MNARDVIFYERLFLKQFREDERMNANRVYANNEHSYATPEDEADAATLEQDTRGEFTRDGRHSSDDDDEDSPGGGVGGLGRSSRGAAPPAPPEPESDDDNVQERHGIDFDQTFAPVSHHTTVRILLAIVVVRHLPLHQIDVENAFLYALVVAVIYADQPHTYGEGDSHVRQLRKSLHGINILFEIGFLQLPHDPGMYRRDFRSEYILLTVYIDDLLYIGSSNELLEQFEKNLMYTAAKYSEELGKHFNIMPAPLCTPYRTPGPNHKPVNKALSPAGLQTYHQQLGCLLFASVTCRPELSYIVSQLAQYPRKPTTENLLDFQRALQFFISMPHVGLCYSTLPTSPFNLVGYIDADHAADPENRRSRTGFLFRLEPTGPISWNSEKQELVAPSSAEAEFITAIAAVRERALPT
ncbi:unnamed protein product [Closterium sp. NIES-53]